MLIAVTQPDNLPGSGLEVVLAHTLYAIVGAIAMEKGGLVANEVVRERILSPLGLRTRIS
jgi:large subunit ribosomal protein L15